MRTIHFVNSARLGRSSTSSATSKHIDRPDEAEAALKDWSACSTPIPPTSADKACGLRTLTNGEFGHVAFGIVARWGLDGGERHPHASAARAGIITADPIVAIDGEPTRRPHRRSGGRRVARRLEIARAADCVRGSGAPKEFAVRGEFVRVKAFQVRAVGGDIDPQPPGGKMKVKASPAKPREL